MQIERTDRFKRAYKELTKDDQARAQKALRLLAENQRYPSLRVKKIIRGRKHLGSAGQPLNSVDL
ncbi:MAG: hypothetical protein AAB427_09355 [Chloroflexota bacterium]